MQNRTVTEGAEIMKLVEEDVDYYYKNRIQFATSLQQRDGDDFRKTLSLLDGIQPVDKTPTTGILTDLLTEFGAYLRSHTFPESANEAEKWRGVLQNILKTTRCLKNILSLSKTQSSTSLIINASNRRIDFNSDVGTDGQKCIPRTRDLNPLFDPAFSDLEMKQILSKASGDAQMIVSHEPKGNYVMGYYFAHGERNRDATGPNDVPDEHLEVVDIGLIASYIQHGARERIVKLLLEGMHTSRTLNPGTPKENVVRWDYTHLVDGFSKRLK